MGTSLSNELPVRRAMSVLRFRFDICQMIFRKRSSLHRSKKGIYTTQESTLLLKYVKDVTKGG